MTAREIRMKPIAIAVASLFGGLKPPGPVFYGSWIASQILKADKARADQWAREAKA